MTSPTRPTVEEAPARSRVRERPSGPAAVAPAPSAPPAPPAAPPGETAFRGSGGASFPPSPPGVPTLFSTYLDYLPGIYRDNEFLGRFLLILEHVLSPIERTVDNIPDYFEPFLTPDEFVPWLGAWLGLVLDERWPEERRRALIAAAVDLYQWRGTRRGLREIIRLYTGIEPEIIEPTLREVGASRANQFRFGVRLRVPQGADIDQALLESIIDLEKPAFAAYGVEIIRQ